MVLLAGLTQVPVKSPEVALWKKKGRGISDPALNLHCCMILSQVRFEMNHFLQITS
jgi:hypothetical protein